MFENDKSDKKDDLRIIKTHKALLEALIRLLEQRNFSRLTVNDLCGEAQISRPTFYAHFKDKYDLLEFWLTNIKKEINVMIGSDNSYLQIEKTINQFICHNSKVITNLFENSKLETWQLLYRFAVDILAEKSKNKNLSPQNTVFLNFCAGGIISLLYWQVKNKFPSDLQPINIYFFKIMRHLTTMNQDNKTEFDHYII